MPTPLQLITIAGISALGGAVNSIAGGGMLLVFPALVGLGVPPIVANATGTVALWPGSMGSLWGYRNAMRGARKWAIDLAVPSLIGGLIGAWLLLNTSSARFSALVPWLVFGGTILFMLQRPLSNWLLARSRAARGETDVPAVGTSSLPFAAPPVLFLLLQFGISIYGGYFGAGAGILMLFGLGLMGLTNIHQMNGLKNVCGGCFNAVAAITFATQHIVNWPIAAAMAVGAVIGGYFTSGLAQRAPQTLLRVVISAIGLSASVWLLLHR
jgi:uncharacterized membrane protein YfcA